MVDGDKRVYQHRLTPTTDANGRKKKVEVRSQNFGTMEDTLYHKGSDGIWRRCVHSDEKGTLLQEAHCRIASDATAGKIWHSGLWWPTTQKDAH